MATTVRISIDDQMQAQLDEAEKFLPGLNTPAKLRTGFLLWLQNENTKNQSPTDITDQEFTNLLKSFQAKPNALKLTQGKSFKDWWAENKENVRGQ